MYSFIFPKHPTVQHAVVDEPTPSPDAPQLLTKQPLEYLLAFDVEATCVQGTGFDWPNEIIEWPVVLLKWSDRDGEGRARTLEVVDEFRSYVKPIWRPKLSDFCTSLTGITQASIDCAPQFKTLLRRFQAFLAKHDLVDARTGKPIKRFAFCTDGPFDVRDFCVKTAYINKLPMPEWLRQDVVDVRRIVNSYISRTESGKKYISRMHSLNMVAQLHALDMQFEGRQHCGMDDARNVARILVELGKREVRLEPNTVIHPRKRWPWMARDGQIHFDEATYLNGRPFSPASVMPSISPAPSLTSSAPSVQSSSVHTSRSTSPQRLSPHAPTYQYNPDLVSRIKEKGLVWNAPPSWGRPDSAVEVEVAEAPARMESSPTDAEFSSTTTEEETSSRPRHYSPAQNKPWLAGHSRSRSSPANMTSLPQSLWSPVVTSGPIAIVPPPAPAAATAA
ncbi:3'-5' exonuclease eri1 OS=Schizosaccharomyces pombe (strain 972 / ATCC 24843) GN=eri1 PE=1 SV=1 [Rhizoctonia solani AG-1 IB]|uniref:3'-5' exonuclease eri1 n=1 Tax=Thanatephorus cucumeris (strain AG1-IB / isolate 7/3/14) TaxID=1108050 RepID=A0A0B7F8C9_THACB|nr:3'-5' exonuclease eri1 OS=Schizosaccharomyces pombe (strain 972 / ATCC 24843) GN=eri1 PE=1 SV=1 [Rhizoctonia solani AG-1 IB]